MRQLVYDSRDGGKASDGLVLVGSQRPDHRPGDTWSGTGARTGLSFSSTARSERQRRDREVGSALASTPSGIREVRGEDTQVRAQGQKVGPRGQPSRDPRCRKKSMR